MTRSLPTFCFYLLLCGAFSLAGCGGGDPEPPSAPAVRVIEVSAEVAATRSFSGTTRATTESRLSFLVGGTVARTLVDVGDRVERGQLLAVLDPSDFQLQAQQAGSGVSIAEAQVTQARAGAELAEAEFARIRTLYAEDLLPLSAYDGARTQAEMTRAAVQTAESALVQARAGSGLAQRAVGYTRLTAPISGAVAQLTVEPGEQVAPGQPVAFLTAQGGPMEVEVRVPESVVGQLETGAAVVVRLSTFPDEPFAARVSEIGVAPGRTATTYPVVVTLTRPDARLRSGMAATVEVGAPPGESDGGLVVPVEAVYSDAQGSYVLTVEQASRSADQSREHDAEASRTSGALAPEARATVQRRAVVTGDLRQGGVEVRSGLTAGTRIVSVGGGEIRSGSTVRVLRRDPLMAERHDFDSAP